MYNRYTPKPDGSYVRSRHPDAHQPPRPRPHSAPPEPPCPPREPEKKTGQDGCPISQKRQETPPTRGKPTPRSDSSSVNSFLRQLLPKEFDTGDLMIVLLLLLMAGDCAEDQNTALLTLALYFFM